MMTHRLTRLSRLSLTLAALALTLGWSGHARAADGCSMGGSCKMDDKKACETKVDAKPAAQTAQAAAYPLTTCVVSGDKLGGKMGTPFKYDYQGRELQLCCASCVKTFKKDPAKYLKKLDEAAIKQQKASYALTTCPVSGQKLDGKMGQPFDYLYKGRLVRFCCNGCVKDFNKDPAKYLALIDKAQAAAKPAPAAASAHH